MTPAIVTQGHMIRPIGGGIVHIESGHAHRYYRIADGKVRACDGTGKLEAPVWWRKLPGGVESAVKRALGGGNALAA